MDAFSTSSFKSQIILNNTHSLLNVDKKLTDRSLYNGYNDSHVIHFQKTRPYFILSMCDADVLLICFYSFVETMVYSIVFDE